ncbi:hypothetical protein BDQ12DRAFT_698888 [Crucibulum laeve]|uniref:Kinetochore protein Sos7 coiled-coil domain-containing protein n=1 Tax=Crucibulum laeve TaxID=68775 RepID=A0A5C3M1G9_9AGAR|nr:hypothetical protein BDQ12DRAFT_698888 [Crucibulum laeve]
MASRPSLEIVEQDKNLQAARAFHEQFENANLQLVKNVSDFNSHRLDEDEDFDMGEDREDRENRDPAIVAIDVAAQISFLRKLKFQYLEQNAKDKYVKSIVSDIDDAPIVTAEDNKELVAVNEDKKARLKVAKDALAEVQGNIRTLAPLVEEDYTRIKNSTQRASTLAQQIIDARLALSRIRQTHPQPRLTIPQADQKLIDQVEEMQTLSDEVEAAARRVKEAKAKLKAGTGDVEKLRLERAEVEKGVRERGGEGAEEDGRLMPLYDWYTASLTLHRSIHNLHESHVVSGNELRLDYSIPSSSTTEAPPLNITITLIFAPDTRKLAAANVEGLDDIDELIDSHVQLGDVHGLVAVVLSTARRRAGVV